MNALISTPADCEVRGVIRFLQAENVSKKTNDNLRTAVFWVITQRVVVISYRRFGKTYRSHTQGSRIKNNNFPGTVSPKSMRTIFVIFAAWPAICCFGKSMWDGQIIVFAYLCILFSSLQLARYLITPCVKKSVSSVHQKWLFFKYKED